MYIHMYLYVRMYARAYGVSTRVQTMCTVVYPHGRRGGRSRVGEVSAGLSSGVFQLMYCLLDQL